MTTPTDDTPRPGEPSENPEEAAPPAAENQPNSPIDSSGSDAGGSSPSDASARDSAPTETPAGDASRDSAAQNSTAGDLPEWEPLTPELVEDDAIRADILLRWLVLLFALLMGVTQIAETQTLVHLRAGEYLASHGFLPPGEDVFSYTAAGRPWIQLSWLFDLAVAGAFALGGAVLLSLLKAVAMAGSFSLVLKSGKPGVATWWLSICTVLAVLASYRQFTALPESVTLVGLAILLWVLVQSRERSAPAMLWGVPVLFLFWANLDPRMFLGLGVLALYTLGESLGRLFGRGDDAGLVKRLWIVTAASVAAALVNPFGWHSLAAPISLYGEEYPALRVYATSARLSTIGNFPLFSSQFAGRLDHGSLSGLLLVLLTIVSMALNFRRVPLGHVFAFGGILAAAAAASHELAAGALVGCVLGNVSAQEWYRNTFRQTYTVDVNERLYSMGGRAATVLVVFVIAFLAISGRMVQPDRKRIGLGFEPTFAATLTGLERDLSHIPEESRIFSFLLQQGDLLLWHGRPVFIDSRVAVYTGEGEDDLVSLHDRVRRSLRLPRENEPYSGQMQIWEDAFAKYQVTTILPRLSDEDPDYRTYGDLLVGEKWRLAHLGTMSAAFVRLDPQELAAAQQRLDFAPYLAEFRKQAFDASQARTLNDELQIRPGFARAKSAYERFLSVPRRLVPPDVQAALHYDWHVRDYMSPEGFQPKNRSDAVAACLLAIRRANEGLAVEPNSFEGYLALGDAYSLLGAVEKAIADEGGADYQQTRRFYQAIGAYSQAAKLRPDDFHVQLQLMGQYTANNRTELAYRAVRNLLDILQSQPTLTETERNQRDQLILVERDLGVEVAAVVADANLAISEGSSPFQVAQRVQQAGCTLRALALLHRDPSILELNVEASLLEGLLQLEAGEPEESWEIFARLEGVMAELDPTRWRSNFALACLTNAQYERAVALWEEQILDLRRQRTELLLHSTPIASPQSRFPIDRLASAQGYLMQLPFEMTELAFNIAMCHLETGHVKEARKTLEELQVRLPNNHLRPLILFYLHQLTGELVDIPLGPSSIFTPLTGDELRQLTRPGFYEEPVEAPRPETSATPPETENAPNEETP